MGAYHDFLVKTIKENPDFSVGSLQCSVAHEFRRWGIDNYPTTKSIGRTLNLLRKKNLIPQKELTTKQLTQIPGFDKFMAKHLTVV
jgi:hypothetical protein